MNYIVIFMADKKDEGEQILKSAGAEILHVFEGVGLLYGVAAKINPDNIYMLKEFAYWDMADKENAIFASVQLAENQ